MLVLLLVMTMMMKMGGQMRSSYNNTSVDTWGEMA